jgi:hypothetical protein
MTPPKFNIGQWVKYWHQSFTPNSKAEPVQLVGQIDSVQLGLGREPIYELAYVGSNYELVAENKIICVMKEEANV